MNLLPFAVVWVVLFVVVIVLIFYRRSIAAREDDTLHVLEGDQKQVEEQFKVAKKLEVVDKWGKILTLVTVLYGLVLLGAYAYFRFLETTKIPVS